MKKMTVEDYKKYTDMILASNSLCIKALIKEIQSYHYKKDDATYVVSSIDHEADKWRYYVEFILPAESRRKVGEDFYWKMWAAKEMTNNVWSNIDRIILYKSGSYHKNILCQILKKEWFR